MLKALIFDVDGTLAQTEEAHRAAFNATFKDWGLDWFWDKVLYRELLTVGGSKERIRHYAHAMKPKGCAIVLEDDGNVIKMFEQKTARYVESVSSGKVALRPGVERIIHEARDVGVRLGIATTTNLVPLEGLFKGTLGKQALGWFEAIAAGDMAENKKPAPDLYRLALKELNLQPLDCLALEDSKNGLLSARAAGIPTLITVNEYTEDQDFTGALAVISGLGTPEQPFLPLSGVAKKSEHVTLDLMKQWHQQGALSETGRTK